MNLNEFLIKHRMQPDEFAVGAKISISSVYRYLRGAKMHRATAKKIEIFTENECTYEELVEGNDGDK